MKNWIFVLLIVMFGMSIPTNAQFYTGSNTTFGQNRVQYHDFFWQFYHFQQFKVYFYAGGENHAVYAAKSAAKYMKELEKVLDYGFDGDDLELVIFNSQSEFKESNIGLTNEEGTNIGGTTRIVGDKVFLYYEGDHDKLDRQIRSGLSKIIAFKMMYGGNWREALKNSSLLSLPEWYIEGFVAFMEGPWTTELDNELKSEVKGKLFSNLNHLEGEDARLAGHAIWNYVSEVYGDKMIPNVLYMTRLSKNVESGFLYVLGSGLGSLNRDVKAYYNARYDEDLKFGSEPKETLIKIKAKKKYDYYNYTVSPDGKYAAFATNELGQYKVWVYNIHEKKIKKIAKGNYKLNRRPDYSYPVMSWHPTSRILGFATEDKGDLLYNIYDVEEKKVTPKIVPKLSKILSMSYNSDGKKIAMSGVWDGQTDIYVYNVLGGNKKRLTNDVYDDLNPSFVENDTKVIFASNRDDDTIRKNVEIQQYRTEKDIFIVDIKRPDRPLTRITNTPLADENYPQAYDGKRYTYLSNRNGIANRYIAYYDSAISYIDTAIHYRYFSVEDRLSNFNFPAKNYVLNPNNGTYSFMQKSNSTYSFYRGDIEKDLAFEENNYVTQFMQTQLESMMKEELGSGGIEQDTTPKDPNAVDINDYQFGEGIIIDSEEVTINFTEDTSTIQKFEPLENDSVIPFELPRQQIYKINFANDYVVSQFDNSFLNQTYQRLSPNGYNNPGFNGIFKVGLKDVFEDYRIIGGFRYPVNFSNTEYVLAYENLKHRLDKKFMVSRRSFREPWEGFIFRVQNYEFRYHLKYPFSEVASVRFTANARYDRNVALSTEPIALLAENSNEYYGGAKLEYVFDATRDIATNIKFGTRFKLWGEYMQEIAQENGDFFTFGFDFRHNQKIHRTLSFATRVAASTSLGSQRLVYFMGGVDNWMNARFDQSIQISPDENYQFQTIATPMRGFFQNARNGNTFAVINNELRFPIFKYLAKNPIRSDFISNFMIVGFADVGTAWTGLNPYDLENSFNTTIVTGTNYEVILENQKEPIIYGYGGGLRSKVLGYYLRFDIAWGVDDGARLDPVTYFSLSLDF